jgi:hypothetical protein
MVVVADTASFVSGVFWRTEAHRVLRAFAEGRILPAYSREILHDLEQACKTRRTVMLDPIILMIQTPPQTALAPAHEARMTPAPPEMK